MAKHTRKNAAGTSFHGTTITATPQQLIDLFPNSYYRQNDGRDKTNFDFTLETESGNVFTIYDWKEYRSLDMNERVRWHVGANNKEISMEGAAEVRAMLK
jgi:hypothetical protein